MRASIHTYMCICVYKREYKGGAKRQQADGESKGEAKDLKEEGMQEEEAIHRWWVAEVRQSLHKRGQARIE